jgi:uncharacterized protein YcfJ
MKYSEKVFHSVVLSCALGMFSGLAFGSESNVMGQTRDVYKTVIQQKPYTVEVCKQVTVPGDKTADTVVGTILGGVIGHQIDHKDGAKIGGVLGGIIGNQNSKAVGGTQTQCQTETRYEEETIEVYSHSVVTFWDNGREYRVRYQK